ncbi:hypothetical protein [Actinoplanes philippinensis]|uniref:hypothetical protein n=1 Tax=Actinoplanes philippinensis TaxID=35752 RepID=UPI0033FB16E0
MNIAVRPLVPVLLGTALLTVAACDSEPPSAAGDPSAAVRWTGFGKDCPALTGAGPGKRAAAPYDGARLFSLRCQYMATGVKQQNVALSVTVYRAASGGSTAEQLAVATMDRDRAADTAVPSAPAPSASPSAPVETEPIKELGDHAFARVVPEMGVRVYARSANALVQLDYTDAGDGRKALTAATDLTRQALAGLR